MMSLNLDLINIKEIITHEKNDKLKIIITY